MNMHEYNSKKYTLARMAHASLQFIRALAHGWHAQVKKSLPCFDDSGVDHATGHASVHRGLELQTEQRISTTRSQTQHVKNYVKPWESRA